MNLNQGGVLSLWKGLIPTLWRDVPFSGVYWMCYEYYKASFSRRFDQSSRWNVWLTSFLSGGASGTVATLATHPFDVLKTRKQASILCLSGAFSSVVFCGVHSSLTRCICVRYRARCEADLGNAAVGDEHTQNRGHWCVLSGTPCANHSRANLLRHYDIELRDRKDSVNVKGYFYMKDMLADAKPPHVRVVDCP